MMSSLRSGDEGVELVEERAPATLVVVARGFVEELGVMKNHQRAGAVRLQRDRHQRFALRRRMPGPGEDQPLVRHDFAIEAARFEIFAVLAGKRDAVATA